MSSAARSSNPEILSGPVAICVDRPLLALDRSFTYELPAGLGAGVGSLVQVPFHGKAIRGWVLGTTEDIPARMLPVRKVVSPVRFFDASMLALLRWVSERYVAPLASVISRAVPPRVVGEEVAGVRGGAVAPLAMPSPTPLRHGPPAILRPYTNGSEMIAALHEGQGNFVVRPAPGEDVAIALETVGAALSAGRSAIVLVPEADPLPATAIALQQVFGDSVAMFLGGGKRSRYRMWLDIGAGRYRVVIGTRPAVFAPLAELGLMYVARESHTQHREERSPYYHVRDVAIERARAVSGVCVMSAVCPSLEASVADHLEVSPTGRTWPPVEVVKPGVEGRAPRLVRALREVRRAFLYEPMRGYGLARVCKACGEPAACAVCRGPLRSEEGHVRCTVCGAEGRCANCGASRFGLARGGVERVEEWARVVVTVPVTRLGPEDAPRAPGEAEVVVGGLETLKDLGPVGVDLVGILNADAALRRPGMSSRERALSAWMEAAAWARVDGRVIVQTNRPNDPAVQALVTGRPDRFARAEIPRLTDAGFPPGVPIFRVVGSAELEDALATLHPRTALATALGDETVCLLALDPGDVAWFGRAVRELAERGVVTRVEAEPHL